MAVRADRGRPGSVRRNGVIDEPEDRTPSRPTRENRAHSNGNGLGPSSCTRTVIRTGLLPRGTTSEGSRTGEVTGETVTRLSTRRVLPWKPYVFASVTVTGGSGFGAAFSSSPPQPPAARPAARNKPQSRAAGS